MKSITHPVLSVIVPVMNEQKNIALIGAALDEVWKKLPEYSREIIFIDDGSTDGTWSEVSALAAKDPTMKGIRFTRNFGKEAAIEAGLKAATGHAVVTMDGDLQHPPELILDFVKSWKDGNEIIRARNSTPPHRGFLKKLTSSMFYSLLKLVSETPLRPGTSDFSLLDRKVVDTLNLLTEKGKFHRILTEWSGFRSTSISYTAPERHSGKSAYNIRKLFTLARGAIVSSSTLPMTLIFVVGCFLILFGGLLTVGLLLYKLFVDFEYIGGSIIVAAFVIFNNGLLMVALGIMSLYQISTYREVQNRPNYLVKETT